MRCFDAGMMSAMGFVGLVVVVLIWAVLTFGIFMVVLLIDEDQNHWFWPPDREGPGAVAEIRFVLLSAVVAAVPVASVTWWLNR